MPTVTESANELRDIQELREQIIKLKAALYDSTDMLEIGIENAKNQHDQNYMRRQIDENKRLLGIGQ